MAGYGITADSWAVAVALATLRHLELDATSGHGGPFVTVLEVGVLSPESLSIVFNVPWFDGPVGLHVDMDTPLPGGAFSSAREVIDRAGNVNPEQLGFDIAHLVIGEPFGEDAVGTPDDRGIRWMIWRTE